MSEGRHLIGLDWGTTSFRGYRIRGEAIVERREAAAGILGIKTGGFEGRLRDLIGDWLEADPDLPLIASGMITSRQGWIEVPYVPCPCGVREIAAGLHTQTLEDGRRIDFVPGVSVDGAGNIPDVIRGEETQIIGALEDGASSLCVLPGTHSKWVEVEGGCLTRFGTFMTGELFAILKAHSILGRLMEEPSRDQGDGVGGDGFVRGLERARDPGSLLQKLFGSRTLPLFDRLAPADVAPYLSGLLIGSEIEGALRGRTAPTITLVGTQALTERYAFALNWRGLEPRIAAPDVVARGLARLFAVAEPDS